jgi:Periplasmic copper-binding protein (NosD)
MKSLRLSLTILAITILALACTSPAHAQATRTWVSGVGDDVNPCSRTAPCKTFAGAISKTAAGGEINCIDPGGYGAVTITKAMTIDCGGTFGSVLASGTNGINVVAGATDTVNLRNLDINGAGGGITGIVFQSGKLHVEGVYIHNFTTAGISANVSAASGLTVQNVTISETGAAGISLASSSGIVQADIANARISSVTNGINALTSSFANVRNSSFSFCSTGIAEGQSSLVTVTQSQFSLNNTGVSANNASAISLFSNTFGNNATALNPNGGLIYTDGNNGVAGSGAVGVANGGAATKI